MSAFVTALGNLFKKPATVCYPFEPTYKPTDYRGLIEHVPEVCIWCRRCEIDCLSGAIVFSQDLEGQQTFHYNPYVCIYCGECVAVCPKEGSIFQIAANAAPAVKAQDVNNQWGITFDNAVESRKVYMAEKKRLADLKKAEQAAAAAEAKAAAAATVTTAAAVTPAEQIATAAPIVPPPSEPTAPTAE